MAPLTAIEEERIRIIDSFGRFMAYMARNGHIAPNKETELATKKFIEGGILNGEYDGK